MSIISTYSSYCADIDSFDASDALTLPKIEDKRQQCKNSNHMNARHHLELRKTLHEQQAVRVDNSVPLKDIEVNNEPKTGTNRNYPITLYKKLCKCKYQRPTLLPLRPLHCIHVQNKNCMKSAQTRKLNFSQSPRHERACKYSRSEPDKIETAREQMKPEIPEFHAVPTQIETNTRRPGRSKDTENSLQMVLYQGKTKRKNTESRSHSSSSLKNSYSKVYDFYGNDNDSFKRIAKNKSMEPKCTKMMFHSNDQNLDTITHMCCLQMTQNNTVCKTHGGERYFDSTSSNGTDILEHIIPLPWKLDTNHTTNNKDNVKDTSNGTDGIKDINQSRDNITINRNIGSDIENTESATSNSEQSKNYGKPMLNRNKQNENTSAKSDDEDSYDKNRVETWLQKNKEWIKQGKTGDRKYDGDRFDQ